MQLHRIKTKNKTVFIPDNAHKQNVLPYQHKVCAPICNTSYIVSNLPSIVVFRETNSSEHTISVLFLVFFCRIISDKTNYFGVRRRWSVRRRWIPANVSPPSFWRTKKSIRCKPSGFALSGLFEFLFLSCLNILPVRWTRHFLCCSTTRVWIYFRLGKGLMSDTRETSVEVNGENLEEMNDGWSLVLTKTGWFTGAAFIFPDALRKSCGLNMYMSPGKSLLPGSHSPQSRLTQLAFIFQTFCQFGRRWRIALGSVSWQYNVFGSPMSA
jgi:hypothetical protein